MNGKYEAFGCNIFLTDYIHINKYGMILNYKATRSKSRNIISDEQEMYF